MATRLSLAALRSLNLGRLSVQAGARQFSTAAPLWACARNNKLSFGGCAACKAKKCGGPVGHLKGSGMSTQAAYKVPRVSFDEHRVTRAMYDADRGLLMTEWANGWKVDYPAVWLRDNCQCSTCFHGSALQRLVVMKDLDVEVYPTDVQTKDDGTVTMSWSDGHSSTFNSAWLREHRFTADAHAEHDRFLPKRPTPWGSELQEKYPTDTFDNIMTTDQGLYDWLCAMEETGLFLMTGIPLKQGMLAEFGKKIAFLKTTNYGTEHSVIIKPGAVNLTFTNARLGLHTDLPYYNYCPGVQFLMCISQVPTKGGDNEFADGFYVAELMRAMYPEEFKILTTTPVRFFDIGEDYYEYHKLHSSPTIELDNNGNVSRIAYNNQVRDSIQCMKPESVKEFYRALKLFDGLLYQHNVLIKLKPGEMICFHNYRVLHGRLGFEIMESGTRHLQTGFMDWDEMFSRRRVLQRKLLAAEN